MGTPSLFQILKNVLFSPEVLFVTVIIILYLNLVFYVVYYRKTHSKINRRIHKMRMAAKNTKQTAQVEEKEETETEPPKKRAATVR
ncbi:hypothetical protein DWQ65_09560 [Treponema phagedenis]|uniref:Uncharacterized protein n=1 Tax=Treponema phagedenis TaxID=162 RepID=A0A0B7H0E8_TREPH|nr:hypothetical protein [Treponema phagedenis]EFW39367.1 hypothetical protein HMPREF9554_00101 [Treponema phagedenis F0421]NVP24096.1 hypothetical protein [Treponema phagedenis]QEJ96236.1 hypothetical protein FUT79_14205 [Treponema phagedenis]QEJ99339.1 hypothetical protein FUT82_15985 [Treponema phagedenis]QEK00015.1 hypothetical protein FUT84_01680 [Treponema phagedenis]